MPVIAIDGPSGVGKSLIAAQLSAFTRHPVIVEGEVGVLPEWMLASLTDPRQAARRTDWFTERCALGCQRATEIHRHGGCCFLDSGPLTHEAYLRVDAQTATLDVVSNTIRLWRNPPTISVLFLDSPSNLSRRIAERGRNEEASPDVFQRVLNVQHACRQVAIARPSLVIHRTTEDYLRRQTVRDLWQEILAHLTAHQQ